MSAATVTRQWTQEEWDRLGLLLFDRLRSRLWLMQETLALIRAARCGESLEVCTTSLEGVYFIVDDMLKEMNEAADILNF